MSLPLKEIYSRDFYETFAFSLENKIHSFNKHQFIAQIFDNQWDNKSLKERMRHTSMILHNFLPDNFEKSALIIEEIVSEQHLLNTKYANLAYMFLPDYIEMHGIDYFDVSTKLFTKVTPFASCEFAVRPFIIKYEQLMIDKMLQWSNNENHHIRRLASEGSRPRLPWAMALPKLKKDPSPILHILENLKKDPSEYVRRSVANNLNDIGKDNPDLLKKLTLNWFGNNKLTDAMLKHGCRSLLKSGDADMLSLFGYQNNSKISVLKFELNTPKISIGDQINFSFTILNSHYKALKVRLEYAIYYFKQNGTYAKKVFKISERLLGENEQLTINRFHSFRIITTRKYYIGKQKLSLIVNGIESDILSFTLTEN